LRKSRTPAAAYDHPAVQATWAAYLDAWTEVANMPGRSERSVPQEEAAREARYRLYEADRAHDAAHREVYPERYQDGPAPATPALWQAWYPDLDIDRDAEPEAEID